MVEAGTMRASLPLDRQCQLAGLPTPVSEYRFHPSRKWRADFCWPDHGLIAEIEGGAFVGGRHTRGAGFVADLGKYNAATLLGYRILRFTPQQVRSGEALNVLTEALK
jgi:very-short-patch-repair endonuclease